MKLFSLNHLRLIKATQYIFPQGVPKRGKQGQERQRNGYLRMGSAQQRAPCKPCVQWTQHRAIISFFFLDIKERNIVFDKERLDEEKLPSLFCNVTWQTAEGAISACSTANLLLASWKEITGWHRKRMLINNSVLWREKRLINIDILSIPSFYFSDICLSYVSSGNPATNEWQWLWNVYVQICRIHNQRKANQIYTGNPTP